MKIAVLSDKGGTGDVPLNVFQSIPIDGIMIVASPQELVGIIVEKAVKMSNVMEVPVLGLIENMSYALCPKCGEKLYILVRATLKILRRNTESILLPIEPKSAIASDKGII